ncbi:alkyl hydroperoxide reductase AhpD [Sphaerisporangium siamense]|uniref:AhpD family alkylhydroperoxidase n=1 Tax=Sphaerisporangium siamense TaxID=795645 RepID=A0A7W7GAH3_9ACTN|nr:carboxymuconolactone decarboxylase family protein [Sphaerisporangium siamense]MBB4702412.1 AhpD family alkylhydroperoxidase [Sphaerisporangium siamense]GII88953.1 alkyl hydroperoxide reductase AhpD [Sphaerisporangium siamense]
MGRMLSRATLPGTLSHVRHVTPVRPRTAPDLVAKVYAQVERDFGMLAPPMLLHSPAPVTLAASWTMLRESLLAAGTAARPLKEAVATAVSRGNACPYCVDVHQATMDGLVRGGHAALVAAGRDDEIDDPGVRRVASWARAIGTRDAAARHEPPLPAEPLRELVAVAVTFHYLNRMVNVFLTESPLPPEVPTGARGTLLRLFGLVMRRYARRAATPGDALVLLPAAPPPADLAWAQGSPGLAAAFARAAAAIDEAGARSVPGPVRDLVAERLAGWDGAPTGISRAWVAEAVTALPRDLRPAGRLALLTAMASYQVDDGLVADFREGTPDDRALVELTSWASMAAARRIGSWSTARPQTAPPAIRISRP